MSFIRRLSTTLFARIDQVVGEIENHEALIQAAIVEQRKKIAAAKVQLSRIQANAGRVAQQIEHLEQEENNWASRALGEAAKDESRALACMQRRQQVREQIGRLQQGKQEYQQAADKMLRDITHCEQVLGSMSQKHEIMRARQSSADALNVINQLGDTPVDELDSNFDRWETRIAQQEILVDSLDSVDQFEQQYRVEENAQVLREQLQQLIAEEQQHGNQ